MGTKQIEEFYDKIFRYCWLKVHQQELAEDLTQETFLRYFERNGKDQKIYLPYLYTTAKNLCIDHSRKHKEELLEPNDLERVGPDDQAEYDLEKRVLQKITVQRLLMELSETDRELLLLRYVNEEQMGTIAKLSGKSRFALYRDLERIKKILIQKIADINTETR